MAKPVYKRVLLKISGEALAGGKGSGLDFEMIGSVCDVIKECLDMGVQVGLVVGGGNFWRGAKNSGGGKMERTRADHIGMLATVMNCLAVADVCEQKGIPVRVQTAIEMRAIAEPYIRGRAIRHLEEGRVVIFGAGTGNPFFSTDTAAVLRAAEINADVILLASGSEVAPTMEAQKLLAEEGIAKMDAVASLTGIDEENVLMSLYARSITKAKIVTKINRTTFSHIIKQMDLGSVFHPRYIAADHIVRYVRAMQNSLGSNVETLYKLVGNRVEALEFRATAKSAVCGKPLMELALQPNLLICAINRSGRILTPGGRDTIEAGDTVVVVTTATGLNDLDDILDKRRVRT